MAEQAGPFFNLKAVVQQTGLKPDTLRAWERRYGLPSPGRSGGRHRLFTQRDVGTIKWLMARQHEGLSISRAVELWQQIEAEGRDPLTSPVPLASREPQPQRLPDVGDALVHLRESWLAACLAFNELLAEQLLAQAFALYSPEIVAVDLLQAAIAEIGSRWYRGEVTVQQEHFATELAVRRLEALIIASPQPTRPGRVLLACPPEEQHAFGLLLLTCLLRRRGWDAIYLGADVPLERLESTLAVTGPSMVIMAAQQLRTVATLLRAACVLQKAGVVLAYGGLAFNRLPSLRARIPGHFLGERIDLAPGGVENLMAVPRPAPATAPLPEACAQARDHFVDRQGLIEADVLRSADRLGLGPSLLSVANRELALRISAAADLGDVGLVESELHWLEGMLKEVPAVVLYDYLRIYLEAARTHLDSRGQPILSWLEKASGQGHLVGASGSLHAMEVV